MKTFFKLFFFLNLLLFPKLFLKSENNSGGGLGEIMDRHVGNVRSEAGVGSVPLGVTIGIIIQVILSLLATVFLILVIMAGFKWMTASGNQEVISKAGRSLKEAIIGLAIVLAAYAITWFIFNQLEFAGGFGIGSGLGGGAD